MPKRDTLTLLDEYERRGLDRNLFKTKLHHLGGSFQAFYKFVSKVNAFSPLQCNQLLHDRLNFIFDQIRNGASTDKSSLETLIERSFNEVPCSRYPNCKGHRFDPHCKHRK